MKMPFGYKLVETYVKNGKHHARWKLRWWYAFYLAFKTAFTMILEEDDPNTEHIDADKDEIEEESKTK